MTAASASSDLRSGGRVSRRAAMSAPIESGHRHLGACGQLPAVIGPHEEVPVLEQPNELLDVQRVALGALEDRSSELGR